MRKGFLLLIKLLFIFFAFGVHPSTAITITDINGDNRIGIEEAIHYLKNTSTTQNGLREALHSLQISSGMVVENSVLSPDPIVTMMAALDTDRVVVAWFAGCEEDVLHIPTGFEVHVSTTGEDFIPTSETIYQQVSATNQLEIVDLLPATLYFVKVKAIYADGSTSKPSNALEAKTFDEPIEMSVGYDGYESRYFKTGDEGLGPFTYHPEDFYNYHFSDFGDISPLPRSGDYLILKDPVDGSLFLKYIEFVSVVTDDGILKMWVDEDEVNLSGPVKKGEIYTSLKMFNIPEDSCLTQQPESEQQFVVTNIKAPQPSKESRIVWNEQLLVAEQSNDSQSLDAGDLLMTESSSMPGSIASEFTASVDVKFEPKFITHAKWGFLKTSLESATIAAQATLQLEAIAKYEFNAAKTITQKKQIFKRKWRSLYNLGPVPVYQDITLFLDLEISASASSSIEALAQAEISRMIEVGAHYDGNQWTPYIKPVVPTESLSASLDVAGNATGEIRLIPRVEVKFYKAVASWISLEPYATSALSTGNISSFTYPNFLIAHPESFIQLKSFEASWGLESHMAITLKGLGWNWEVLPETCVLGNAACLTPFEERTIFSLPDIKDIEVIRSDESSLVVEVKAVDGTNNSMMSNSIQWEAFTNGISVSPKQCTKNDDETTCSAHVTTVNGVDGLENYEFAVSGYGALQEAGRRYKLSKLSTPCQYSSAPNDYASKSCIFINHPQNRSSTIISQERFLDTKNLHDFRYRDSYTLSENESDIIGYECDVNSLEEPMECAYFPKGERSYRLMTIPGSTTPGSDTECFSSHQSNVKCPGTLMQIRQYNSDSEGYDYSVISSECFKTRMPRYEGEVRCTTDNTQEILRLRSSMTSKHMEYFNLIKEDNSGVLPVHNNCSDWWDHKDSEGTLLECPL